MSKEYVLAIHGGAGTINPNTSHQQQAAYHAALQQALHAGEQILATGGTAQAAVVACVQALEDCPLFNAGLGAVFTSQGEHELDACLMDGRDLSAGAVAGINCVKNPILLAQAVKEDGQHVLLSGAGATQFAQTLAAAKKIELVAANYFSTPERHAQLQLVQAAAKNSGPSGGSLLDHDAANILHGRDLATAEKAPILPSSKMGTVGAVARDIHGNLAAATSTGGMTNKRPGRIGDTPIVGAGCYADNRSVAVSCTGTGEHFMRTVLAHQIACRLYYGGQELAAACDAAIHSALAEVGGRGGLIAIDSAGNLALPFNTSGMYRAWQRQGQTPQTAIFATPS
jgi:beta-aspartyl-peptidase (threonine type)